jgi:lipopolysaccharide exporter
MSSHGVQLPTLPATVAADPTGTGQGLVGNVRRGALWTGASTLLLRFSNIILMAVVARIVAPEELGVFALAVTVQAVLVSMAELGVASAIARSDLDIDRIAPTVVTISVVTSLALGSIMAAFAGPVADFLGAPDSEGAIRILAISVALIGPFAVPGAQLQRSFRQDLLFRANMIAFIPSSAVLVLLALGGDGASAFAWSRVAGQLIAGVLMILSVRQKYLPGYNHAYLRPLLKFGVPLAMANILSQVLLNVDYVFIGRLMTETDVGLYMLAFNICMWSSAVISAMLNGIVLPAFSAVRRDGGDLNVAMQHALRTVALIACPLAAFTSAFAAPLITTVYGDKWHAAAPVLSVLSFYGVISVMGLLIANIIIATGRTGILFIVQAIALLVLVPALQLGVTFGGLVGIGVAHILVISVVTFPVYLQALRKSTGAHVGRLLSVVLRPAAAAAVAAALALVVTTPLTSDLLKVFVGGLAGAVVYVICTFKPLQQLLPRPSSMQLDMKEQ